MEIIRNDVLRRDLTDIVTQAGTNGCVVQTGTLDDPFSGAVIEFIRGAETSSDVQIDHVVSLSDAWQKGAQGWDQATLQQFGNDPLNLLAVDGPLNAAKGDGDTATWLPPNTAFRCEYVALQVGVKTDYGLWVTQAEQDAMVRVLSDCPDESLPRARTAPLAPELAEEPAPEPPSTAKPEPEPTPEPEPQPVPGDATDPRFDTCADAIDAGYSNYVRGTDPEYDWYRDGDDDGTVCEE